MTPLYLRHGLRACIVFTSLVVGALFAVSALAANQSPASTSQTLIANKPKEPAMQAYEIEEFSWSLSMSGYNIDMGKAKLETLEYGNNFSDAQGNELMRFFGVSTSPMGGNSKRMRLPKTLQLTYYDYQEDRFYQLNAELPQKRIYELFQQKIVDTDGRIGRVIPRFDAFDIRIAPQGYVMVWISSGDGLNRLELATFRAQPMRDMTVQKYNSTGNYDPVRGGRAFPLKEDRWAFLGNGINLKPDTIAKLKSGWLPAPDYYLNQRVKYPWRFVMTGAGNLQAFKVSYGNQERASVQPWEMKLYKTFTEQRGIPAAATFWFHDAAGKRHSIFMGFFTQMRVTAEADLSPVWQAFETVFPKRTVEDNALIPNEADMATVEINVSDDLKKYTATLVKGEQRISLPIGKTQFFDLEPHAFWPANPTPPTAAIKLLLNGPYVDQ